MRNIGWKAMGWKAVGWKTIAVLGVCGMIFAGCGEDSGSDGEGGNGGEGGAESGEGSGEGSGESSGEGSGEGGGNGDCTSLCEAGQAGDCTSIEGDCGDFCSALDNVAPAAGCSGKVSAYVSCLQGGSDICELDCDNQSDDMTTCLAGYCATKPTDADCQTLVLSLQ